MSKEKYSREQVHFNVGTIAGCNEVSSKLCETRMYDGAKPNLVFVDELKPLVFEEENEIVRRKKKGKLPKDWEKR